MKILRCDRCEKDCQPGTGHTEYKVYSEPRDGKGYMVGPYDLCDKCVKFVHDYLTGEIK